MGSRWVLAASLLESGVALAHRLVRPLPKLGGCPLEYTSSGNC